MNEIMIRCPETGNEISTGIHCDNESFGQLPFIVSHANCPLCGKTHSWPKDQAWLSEPPQTESALSIGVAGRPDRTAPRAGAE